MSLFERKADSLLRRFVYYLEGTGSKPERLVVAARAALAERDAEPVAPPEHDADERSVTWRRAFDQMHQRAMKAEAELRALTDSPKVYRARPEGSRTWLEFESAETWARLHPKWQRQALVIQTEV